jgi:hypothetical protein
MIRSRFIFRIFFRRNYGAGNQQLKPAEKVVILGSINPIKKNPD